MNKEQIKTEINNNEAKLRKIDQEIVDSNEQITRSEIKKQIYLAQKKQISIISNELKNKKAAIEQQLQAQHHCQAATTNQQDDKQYQQLNCQATNYQQQITKTDEKWNMLTKLETDTFHYSQFHLARLGTLHLMKNETLQVIAAKHEALNKLDNNHSKLATSYGFRP